jgi:hypothetical protein
MVPCVTARVVALFIALAGAGSRDSSRDARSALEADPRGWVDIMPPADLHGWTRLAPISTRGVKAAVNRSAAVWVVDRARGVLDCRGQLPTPGSEVKDGTHEMLRLDRELGDFVFHVEWRFVDPARKGWNAGVYARVRPDGAVWHQAQVGDASAGYWFGDTVDATGKIVRVRVDARQPRVKPPGAWNVYEITGRGDTLSLWVNGANVADWKGLHVLRGSVGLEAELHHIEFRNLELKELRQPARSTAAAPTEPRP